jgi:hypothetical protein
VYGAGDLNGDGADDLLVVREGSLRFWFGSARQQLTELAVSDATVIVTDERMPRSLAGTEPVIGDFDGDGLADVLWAAFDDTGADNGQIWFGTRRTGEFAGAPAWGTAHPRGAHWTIGDFDGDTGADVFWYHEGDGAMALHLVEGGRDGLQVTAFADRVRPEMRVVSGDFDGNGLSDLVLYDDVSGLAAEWFFDAGAAIDGRLVAPGAGFRLNAGDFDGDGRDDLIWHGPAAGVDAFWYGTSDRSFRAAPAPRVGRSTVPVVADLDGDGRDDLLWWDGGPEPDTVWLSRNDGPYPVTVEVGPVSQLTMPDFDGDGAADLLFTGVHDAYTGPTAWALWWFAGNPPG